jgi:Flp pilus assembly protein CpaB
MKQRRGWLWLTSGVLLALLAGLMTFQIVNELATTASVVDQKDTITVSVIVSEVDIAPYVAINAGMVKLLEVPAAMAPKEYVTNIEDVIGKMSLAPITLGEILVTPRLVDPADPNAPVLYTMNRDEVLMTVPTAALTGQMGLLSVGQHIDIAYTGEFTHKELVSRIICHPGLSQNGGARTLETA